MAADDYERTVAAATTALTRFSSEVIEDFDEEVGGVGWWDGQIDFRRHVVLSEYLVDSVNGATEALLDAALEAQNHREALHADDTWLRRVWAAAAEAGPNENENFLRAMQRDGAARKRERQIDSSATHSVSHMLRALDCLAAAMLIVGAVPQGVRRADWNDVVKLAEQCAERRATAKLEPLDSSGRGLQTELFSHALRAGDHGPDDWLPWLFATRNSRIHRGARVHWLLLYGDRRRARGLLRPFPPNPDFTDVELMSRRPISSTSGAVDSLRLIKHSTAVIDGCLESMTAFVSELAEALRKCWDARRTLPAVLCQRGAQWQDLERVAELNFPGYGEDPQLIGNEMHVGPELAKRLKSAHVMDADRSRWDG
jgi:hypothetical protein